MRPDSIPRTPSFSSTSELHDAWRYVEILERFGEMDAVEARRFRDGIFERAVALGLDVDLRGWLSFDDV